MDLATGRASVSIPLANVQTGKLSTAVSLSYSTGGIKVSDESGLVGLGWSLQAGGVITRVVRGHPDWVYSDTLNANSLKGFYQFDTLSTSINSSNQIKYLRKIVQNKWDSEPDIFYYQFGRYSGYFSMTFRDSTFRVVSFPDVDLVITPSHTQGADISSFMIVDPDGIVYSFGYTEQTRIYDDEQLTDLPANTIRPWYGQYNSAWYLTGMSTSADLQGTSQSTYIAFAYATHANASPLQSSIPVQSMMTERYGPIGCPSTTDQSNQFIQSKVEHFARLTSISIGDMAAQTLRKVVEFDYEGDVTLNPPHQVLLKYVRVKDISEQTLSSAILNYAFIDSLNPSHKNTLLTRLQMAYEPFPGDNVPNPLHSDPPYLFSYAPGTLPDRSSFDRDYLGHPTAPASPARNFLMNGSPNYRAPDITHAMVGVLTDYTTPEGGRVEFEYEPHDVWNPQTSTAIQAGGLRIERIRQIEPLTGKTTLRTFDYGKGQAYPGLIELITTGKVPLHTFDYERRIDQNTILTCQMSRSLSDGSLPVHGPPVWYDSVVENLTVDGVGRGSVRNTYTMHGQYDLRSYYIRNLPDSAIVRNQSLGVVTETVNTYASQAIGSSVNPLNPSQIDAFGFIRPNLIIKPTMDQNQSTTNDTTFAYHSIANSTLWRYRSAVKETIRNQASSGSASSPTSQTTLFEYSGSSKQMVWQKSFTSQSTDTLLVQITHAHTLAGTQADISSDSVYTFMAHNRMLTAPYRVEVYVNGVLTRRRTIHWRKFGASGYLIPLVKPEAIEEGF